MDICNNIIIGGGGGLRTEGVSPRKRNSQSSQSTNIDVPHLKAQKANTHLEHWCLLDVFTKPHTLSHTGIICTIGMYKALFQLLTLQKCRLNHSCETVILYTMHEFHKLHFAFSP